MLKEYETIVYEYHWDAQQNVGHFTAECFTSYLPFFSLYTIASALNMVAMDSQRMRKGQQRNQQHSGETFQLWGTTTMKEVELRPQRFSQPLWSLWAYLSPGMALSKTSRSIKSCWKIFSRFWQFGLRLHISLPCLEGAHPGPWHGRVQPTYFWGIISPPRIRISANFHVPTGSLILSNCNYGRFFLKTSLTLIPKFNTFHHDFATL